MRRFVFFIQNIWFWSCRMACIMYETRIASKALLKQNTTFDTFPKLIISWKYVNQVTRVTPASADNPIWLHDMTDGRVFTPHDRYCGNTTYTNMKSLRAHSSYTLHCTTMWATLRAMISDDEVPYNVVVSHLQRVLLFIGGFTAVRMSYWHNYWQNQLTEFKDRLFRI